MVSKIKMFNTIKGALYKAESEIIERWKHYEYNVQKNIFMPNSGHVFKKNDLFLCVMDRPKAIKSYIFLHLKTGKLFSIYETHLVKIKQIK